MTALALAALAAVSPGATTIELQGSALRSLRSQGVRIGATRPVRASRSRIVVPASGGAFGAGARLDSRGALRFVRGRGKARRQVRLTGLQVKLSHKGSRVTGKLGGRRLVVLTLAPARGRALSLDAANGAARIAGARGRLGGTLARALKRRLRLRRLPAGTLGTVAVRATGLRRVGGTGGGPASGKLGAEPVPLARPSTAVGVSAAQITWDVRDSFIRYVNSGEGTSVAGGATHEPPEVREGTDTPLVYRFHYPFSRGWYDPPSGKAALYYTGLVNFRYTDHGIDLDAKDAEVELNGGASRAIFRFDGRLETNPGNKRGVLVDLDPSKASRTVSNGGKTISYAGIPGRIPQGGATSVFAGYYQPGDPFGSISVTFTTP